MFTLMGERVRGSTPSELRGEVVRGGAPSELRGDRFVESRGVLVRGVNIPCALRAVSGTSALILLNRTARGPCEPWYGFLGHEFVCASRDVPRVSFVDQHASITALALVSRGVRQAPSSLPYSRNPVYNSIRRCRRLSLSSQSLSDSRCIRSWMLAGAGSLTSTTSLGSLGALALAMALALGTGGMGWIGSGICSGIGARIGAPLGLFVGPLGRPRLGSTLAGSSVLSTGSWVSSWEGSRASIGSETISIY